MMTKQSIIILLILIIAVNPIAIGQNTYQANVIQPDPLGVPSICIVTTADSNNIVVWEKNASPFTGYFRVYRESTSQTNKWDLLGLVEYGDNSIFIDSTSNPANQSYNYKIAAIDLCGNETELSESHKTMNLSIALGINKSYSLIWSEYEGFDVNNYSIYRGTNNSELIKIASTAAGNFNYNDYNPPAGKVYYQIEVTSPNSCDPTQLKSVVTYSSSRSNIVTTDATTSAEYWGEDNAIEVFPNPFNDRLNVTIEKEENENYFFTVFDIAGQKLFEDIFFSNEYEFNRGDLPSGLYFIEVKGTKLYRTKIIITD